MLKPFLEHLDKAFVICDGAMGTQLYSKGVFLNRCFDELNLSRAPLVRASSSSLTGWRTVCGI